MRLKDVLLGGQKANTQNSVNQTVKVGQIGAIFESAMQKKKKRKVNIFNVNGEFLEMFNEI